MSDQELRLDSYIRRIFDVQDVDIKTYSPLTLAYIGDGIFDLIIRTVVVGRGNTKASRLHYRTSQIVKARTQAQMAEALEDYMTAGEKDIYRRGRNAKSPTMAKNASMSDYRKATGFEALMGYLYLNDEMERIIELIHKGVSVMELDI